MTGYKGAGTAYRRRPLIERVARRASVIVGGAVPHPLKRLYHGALHAQTLGRGMKCELPGGEVVRVLPEYAHLSWNPEEYRAFRAAVPAGTTALDVGANVGAYALLLGQWVGPSGFVYAFEPAPGPFAGLSAHIALNGLTERVEAVRSAVAASESSGALIVAPSSGESRLAGPGEAAPAATTVPVTTIDAFCAERGVVPSFIKIDVEGAELDALRGARETIQRAGSRLALFVELHPATWPLLGISPKDVAAEFERQQLEPFSIAPGADVWTTEGVSIGLRRR